MPRLEHQDIAMATQFRLYEQRKAMKSSQHFSKAEKSIAFTAEYDGNVDVYTISV